MIHTQKTEGQAEGYSFDSLTKQSFARNFMICVERERIDKNNETFTVQVMNKIHYCMVRLCLFFGRCIRTYEKGDFYQK